MFSQRSTCLPGTVEENEEKPGLAQEAEGWGWVGYGTTITPLTTGFLPGR